MRLLPLELVGRNVESLVVCDVGRVANIDSVPHIALLVLPENPLLVDLELLVRVEVLICRLKSVSFPALIMLRLLLAHLIGLIIQSRAARRLHS